MLIAFKTHASNPQKNSYILDRLPWQKQNISIEESELYRNTGWSVMTEEDYNIYVDNNQSEQIAYDQEVKNSTLKIMKLVRKEFKHYHPSKIDFTVHLETNITLVKKVIMAKNGRPLVAKYYYPDSSVDTNLMAEIKFEFVDNASKFMIERKELLGYYLGDNTVPEYYLIHKRTYDFNNVTEAANSLSERTEARSNIIAEIKIVAQGVLFNYYLAQGQTPQVASVSAIIEGTSFFNLYRNDISNFIEVASSNFKNNVLNDNVTNFLNSYCAPNVTLRQYIYDRLSY